MQGIRRIGNADRWSDIVIHHKVARWVEVASDLTMDSVSQISQVLSQIDETLLQIGSDRTQLLQIMIYLADLEDIGVLNAAWDSWISPGNAPIRACVQAGLQGNCLVEMVISAAVP